MNLFKYVAGVWGVEHSQLVHLQEDDVDQQWHRGLAPTTKQLDLQQRATEPAHHHPTWRGHPGEGTGPAGAAWQEFEDGLWVLSYCLALVCGVICKNTGYFVWYLVIHTHWINHRWWYSVINHKHWLLDTQLETCTEFGDIWWYLVIDHKH